MLTCLVLNVQDTHAFKLTHAAQPGSIDQPHAGDPLRVNMVRIKRACWQDIMSTRGRAVGKPASNSVHRLTAVALAKNSTSRVREKQCICTRGQAMRPLIREALSHAYHLPSVLGWQQISHVGNMISDTG